MVVFRINLRKHHSKGQLDPNDMSQIKDSYRPYIAKI